MRVWDKTGEDCPSHAGKGDKEREMKAKRRGARLRGCVCGERTEMCKGLLSKRE